MISTILKSPPEGFENHFAGNFEELPDDRIEVDPLYTGGLCLPVHNGSGWIEGADALEKARIKQGLIAAERLRFQEKIDRLVAPYVQKLVIDGAPIPESILIERQALRDEFHSIINNF